MRKPATRKRAQAGKAAASSGGGRGAGIYARLLARSLEASMALSKHHRPMIHVTDTGRLGCNA
jgi:hypothetical protein